MRSFTIAALVGSAAAAVAPGTTMDCQAITSVTDGVAKTDLNPEGISLPEGFVIGSAKNLCIAPRGQFCQVIKKRMCTVSGGAAFATDGYENKCSHGVSHDKVVLAGSPNWVNLSPQQMQIAHRMVCFHAPQDHMNESNECQVRFNYKLANGSMHRWAVSLGEHNVPHFDGALDSVVVAGKGCIALRYDQKDAKGREMPLSEGYHARFPVQIRSINVLAPRSKVCLAGEELVASRAGDKCAPCAAGFLSREGDNKCHKATVCSHVTCRAVTPGSTYKKCKGQTYKSLAHHKDGSFTWMGTNDDSYKCNQRTAPGFFLHTFHHGKEDEGTHHTCKVEAGKCVCRCYSSKMSFTPPQADCPAVFAEALSHAAGLSTTSETICFGTVKAAVEAARCVDSYDVDAIRAACAPVLWTNVDINLANKATLDKLYGIGDAYAQNIIDYREQNGYFATLEDVKAVSGVSQNKLDKWALSSTFRAIVTNPTSVKKVT